MNGGATSDRRGQEGGREARHDSAALPLLFPCQSRWHPHVQPKPGRRMALPATLPSQRAFPQQAVPTATLAAAVAAQQRPTAVVPSSCRFCLLSCLSGGGLQR